MLRLHYNDLRRVRTILSQDQDTSTDYLLHVVDKEIEKVPEWMIPACLRKPNDDIYLCNEREVEDRVRRLSQSGSFASGFLMVIHCPHDHVARFVYDRITSLIQTKSANKTAYQIVLPNDAKVKIVQGRPGDNWGRGHRIDMGIVFSYDDGPSA